MKKIIFAVLTFIALAFNASANDRSKISNVILNSFYSDFNNAENVEWQSDSRFTKASFELNGEKVTAFYLYDGTFLGLTKSIALNELPQNAIREFTKEYPFPLYNIKECIAVTNENGELNYYISFNEKLTQKTIILKITPNGGVYKF